MEIYSGTLLKFFPAAIFSGLFRRWQKKFYLLLLALLLALLTGVPAQAAVDAVVARAGDGTYHQYSYADLLDSYALSLLNRSNGLYEDYAAKEGAAVLNSAGRYIDYAALLDSFALALASGRDFCISDYVTNGKAPGASLPATLNVVTLSGSNLRRAELTIEQPVRPKGSSVPAGDAGPIAGSGNAPNPSGSPGGASEQTPGPGAGGQAASSAPPPPLVPSAPAQPVTVTPIMGPAEVSLEQARQWALSRGAHRRFLDVAPLYWHYGTVTGIRPEVLYAQAAYETGFGRYGGIVPPEFNNWAGIKKASSNGDLPQDHESFATPGDGVRAHFNHMAAYTGIDPVGEPHGRYYTVTRIAWAGTVKTVEGLSGKWAPSPGYHERIVTFLDEMSRIGIDP